MKKAILVLSLTVTIVPAFGQLRPEQATAGAANGRFWLALTKDHKTGIIYGFCEGINAAIRHTDRETKRKLRFGYLGAGTVGESVKGLDHFYAEPANGSIPIRDAMVWFHLKQAGVTAAEIEELTVRLRREAAKADD